MKVFEHIELEVYREGDGYSNTEDIESSGKLIDLEATTWEDYTDLIKEYLYDEVLFREVTGEEYYVINISLYEEGKDPMFNEPVKKIRIKAYRENEEIIIKEA